MTEVRVDMLKRTRLSGKHEQRCVKTGEGVKGDRRRRTFRKDSRKKVFQWG